MTWDQHQFLVDVAETGRQYAHPANLLVNEMIEAGLLLAHDSKEGGRYVTITDAGNTALQLPGAA